MHDLPLFILSGLLLNITPGPDTLYILGRSVAQGRVAGLAAALGISVGCLVHTFAAAFGLSALLATSAYAFLVVKFAGAAYLVWQGIRLLRQRQATLALAETARESPRRIFRDGVITNVLNPKVALFFLAFLPQFVDPAETAKITAFLTLGFIFVAGGMLWCLVLVGAASWLGHGLRRSTSAAAWLNRACGALFLALGVRLAFQRSP